MDTREADHVLSQIKNPHGLPHVQYKKFTILCHGTAGQHQLAGLGYGHKVANDPLIRNRHRATIGDLLFEEGNYRTCRPQHIAKPGGAVFYSAMGAGALH